MAQNKAARLVLGCSPRTSVAEMHERLTWLRVKDRLSANVLIYLHRIINTQTPKISYDNMIYCSNTNKYSNILLTLPRPLPKSDSMKLLVFFSSIAFWNSLPGEVCETKGKAGFQRRLRMYLISTSIYLNYIILFECSWVM